MASLLRSYTAPRMANCYRCGKPVEQSASGTARKRCSTRECGYNGVPMDEGTYCPYGHPWEDCETFNKNGSRTCARAEAARLAAREKEGDARADAYLYHKDVLRLACGCLKWQRPGTYALGDILYCYTHKWQRSQEKL